MDVQDSAEPEANWLSIQVEAPPQAWDAIASLLIEAGCAGVQLCDQPPRVVGYLSEEQTDRVPSLQERLHHLGDYDLPPVIAVHIQPVTEQDWHTLWRRHFRSRRFGARLRVQPSWSKRKPQEGELLIQLDPGLAFGTGSHPTTALCLELLDAYVRPGMRVADLGTGTGILAIACAKLEAREVVAVDNDPLSVQIAEANAQRNGVGHQIQVLLGDGWDALQGTFDLIACNIISTFHLQTASRIPEFLADGGYYLASGVIGRNWREVRRAIEQQGGLNLLEVRKRRTWVAGMFQRASA